MPDGTAAAHHRCLASAVMFALNSSPAPSSGKIAMRALIVLSLIAIVFSSTACEAGMSTGPHKAAAATHPASHVASSHHRGHVRHARARGIGGPIAAVGNVIGSTGGGVFRREGGAAAQPAGI